MKLSDIKFLIPAITLSGVDLVNVVAFIKGINYDFEMGSGVLVMRVGETVNSKILYAHEVDIVLDQGGTFGAQDMINAVLAALPNATIIE